MSSSMLPLVPTGAASEIFQRLNDGAFGTLRDAVDQLNDRELSRATSSLPRVVVVGSESVGKSSLLESVTKCPVFPRDSKFCTKMPVHFCLQTVQTAEESIVEVAFPALPNQQRPAQRRTLPNTDGVLAEVTQFMALLGPMEIIAAEIKISIRGQDVPTLEFVDLPGLRAFPPQDATITEDLARRYLEDPHTLFICVDSALSSRLTNNRALALISKYKKAPQSLLVLTKVDLVIKDNFAENVTWRLQGSSNELNGISLAGVFGVVNRTHDAAVSLDFVSEHELGWLRQRLIDFEVPTEQQEVLLGSHLGLGNLLDKIADVFYSYFLQKWRPHVLSLLDTRSSRLADELAALGPADELASQQEVYNQLWANLRKAWPPEDAWIPDEVKSIVPDVAHLEGAAWGSKDWSNGMFHLLTTSSSNVLDKILNSKPFFGHIKGLVAEAFTNTLPLRLDRYTVLQEAVIKRAQDCYTERLATIKPVLQAVLSSQIAPVLGARTVEARRLQAALPKVISGAILAHAMAPALSLRGIMNLEECRPVVESQHFRDARADIVRKLDMLETTRTVVINMR